MDEALDFQCGSRAVSRKPYHYPEGEDERRRIGLWLWLPGLARDICRWNHGSQLCSYCSAVNLSRLVVQLARWLEQTEIRLVVPVWFGNCPRYQRLAQVRSHDCGAGSELRVVVEPLPCELERLICYQDD